MIKRCECCGEREQHELCAPYCAECAKPAVCDCGRELSDWDNADWTPENQVSCSCEHCRQDDEQVEAFDALYQRVVADAEAHGWDIDHEQRAETGSRYLELSKDGRTLKVRVADHGTAYCSEDISLVSGQAGGDDHDYRTFLDALQEEATCED